VSLSHFFDIAIGRKHPQTTAAPSDKGVGFASLFRAASIRNPLKSQGTDGSSRHLEEPLDTLIEPLSNPRLVGVRAECTLFMEEREPVLLP
jgi:hypothetical protein